MSKLDCILVTITNWEDYNPRSDRGGFAWFRMDNQFYLHMRQRKGASVGATILLGFLLAECSAADGKPFKLRPVYAGELLGKSTNKIWAALKELEVMGDCVLEPLEAASCLTDGRTDGRTDETDDTKGSQEFESFWERYPKAGRVGKAKGMEMLRAQIKTDADRADFSQALENYLKSDRVKNGYVKDWFRWVAIWRDFILPGVGQSTDPREVNRKREREIEARIAREEAEALEAEGRQHGHA